MHGQARSSTQASQGQHDADAVPWTGLTGSALFVCRASSGAESSPRQAVGTAVEQAAEESLAAEEEPQASGSDASQAVSEVVPHAAMGWHAVHPVQSLRIQQVV